VADFCKQCLLEEFGEDTGDLAGLISEEDSNKGFRARALCEGCGLVYVDHTGLKWTSKGVEGEWTPDTRTFQP
jgi:hypothetical protein